MVYLYCMQPRELSVQFYAIQEKVVRSSGRPGSSGRVYLPADWINKKVLVLLQEPLVQDK